MIQPSRTARYYYLKILRLKGDPHSLAIGTAIGILIGISPTIPVQTILVIAVAWLFRGNLIAALLVAHLMSNPVTWLPQYYFSWRIGNWLFPGRLSWERILELLDFLDKDPSLPDIFRALMQLGIDALLVVVFGGTLLAIPFALAGYFLSLRFFQAIRKKRREKHVLT